MTELVGFELSVQQRASLGAEQTVSLMMAVPDVAADEIRARIDAVAARHEILRSTVRPAAGLTVPLQVVHETLPVAWCEPGESARADELLERQTGLLDRERGPVLAAGLVRDGTTPVLVVTALRTVADLSTLELVAAAVRGEPIDADPVQYAEYAAWQEERLTASDREERLEAEEVWLRLAGDAPAAVLTPGPVEPGPVAPIPVPTLGTAPGGVDGWLAAWAVVLARLTGQDELCLGVELDPRSDPELDGAAGPYARVVPFAVAVTGDSSFDALVDRVRRDRALATRWVDWAPAAAHGSLQTVFSVGPAGGVLVRADVQVELRVAADAGSAWVVPGTAGSRALAEHVAAAVDQVLRTSGGLVRDAEVLTVAEQQRLLGDASVPAATLPVIEQILAQAELQGGRTAVTDGTVELTYRDLVDRVDGLAQAIRDGGADISAPVAVLLPRSTDLIVAMLAAQRAGAGYLPLDADQPPNRLRHHVDAAGATTLISDGTRPEWFGGRVLPVTGHGDAPLLPGAPEQLAYLVFTSGSTGVPKGVAVPESALANYVAGIRALVADLTGDRPLHWALMTSPTTDLGNTAVFPALASGGTLHVVPTAVVQEPAAVARYVEQQSVDVMKITPSHLEALLADDSAAVLPREVLLVGGEVLTWPLVDRITARGTCRIVNHYGPTETTVGALVHRVDPARRTSSTVPIGAPLPGVEAQVLDSRLRLAPPGALGELAIGGAGLARGYWGDAAATAARFVDHPYRPGRRLYLTGDLVRRRDDGAVEFHGRRDGQVKIRGFRVERGEIEAALRRHPGVQRTAVVVRTDLAPGPALVAYVVSQVNPAPSERDLRDHVADLLPEHMVPSRIVVVDALPLRPNGKLDEGALPLPPARASGARVAPATPTEGRIAAIYADVLGTDEVGVADDFFELGGHSLLATRVIVQIRATLGVQLPVYALFETPTVRGLAAQADAAEAARDEELARLIAELEDMSDEEAAALLAAESGEDPQAGEAADDA
jgi:amino acid adenylation domain-containing protein